MVAHHTKVHFASDYHMEASAFVGCFQSYVEHQEARTSGPDQGDREEVEEGGSEGDELKMRLKFKSTLTEEYSIKLGRLLFCDFSLRKIRVLLR